MAFRSANMDAHFTKFNSASSSDLLEIYDSIIEKEIIEHDSQPKHKAFAPSSFRCLRLNWFRLRGVQPDITTNPDIGLDFTAKIGTACHKIIQERLCNHLKEDWIDVKEYMDTVLKPDYEYSVETKGYESLIEINDPPVRFACDGIIRINNKLYLLEIKTSEFGSFNELVNPKPQHVDQITCYSALLGLPDVLVLYQDRQYGSTKCFEMHISDSSRQEVLDKMDYVQRMVEAKIAPDGLPKGDTHCSSNMCPYFKVCKEWG